MRGSVTKVYYRLSHLAWNHANKKSHSKVQDPISVAGFKAIATDYSD